MAPHQHLIDGFNAYQQFTDTTAVYPQEPGVLALAYAGLGLGDEQSELDEKIQRVLDEGRLQPSNTAPLIAEIGDVLWYIARVCQHTGLEMGALYAKAADLEATFVATLDGLRAVINRQAGAVQGRIKKFIRDGNLQLEKVEQALVVLLRALEALAGALTLPLITVAHMNQTKLSKRQEAGTLKGDGDHR